MVKFSALLSALFVFAAESFRTGDEHGSALDPTPNWNFNNVQLGPVGGPLVPGMVPPANTSFEVQSRERLDILESNEYRWAFVSIRQGQVETPINQWFAKIDGSFLGNLFGHRRTEVCNNAGTPIFAIEMAHYTWNPFALSWSFRIVHTITDEILYTINKDWVGAGFAFLRDEWRIYRGRRRDGNQIYHMTSSYLGYSHRFYYEKPLTSWLGTPVAESSQHVVRHIVGLPDVFSLVVHEGEDTALLLAATVIVDMVHESELAAREREEAAEAAENSENSENPGSLFQAGSREDVWSEEAMAKAEIARR